MWNLFGVVVLNRSMVNWLGSGVNLPNMNLLWNLLYMKLIWCNGFPEIYAWLEEEWGQSVMGICALCYTWNLFGVMVFQRYILNWKGVHLLNLNSLQNLLDMKLIWCNGFPEIYASLEEGSGVNLSWNLFSVVVLQRSMVDVGVPSAWSICVSVFVHRLSWCGAVAL